jgi:hypothetical protein
MELKDFLNILSCLNIPIVLFTGYNEYPPFVMDYCYAVKTGNFIKNSEKVIYNLDDNHRLELASNNQKIVFKV